MAVREAQRIGGGASEVMLDAKLGGRRWRWVISREHSRLGSARKPQGGREPVGPSACCRVRKWGSDAGRLRRGIGVGGFGESGGCAAPGLVAEGEGMSVSARSAAAEERSVNCSTMGEPKNLEGYVGFANLPNQVYRKSVKRGFEFTLMVVGESGLGKSTLINSLFLTDLYSPEYPGPSHRIKKTVQVEQSKVLIKEGGVQLLLTIVDTPGFGDAVDNSNCWQPVIDYIDSKFEDYLNAESRVNRRQMPDNRVQCCLYFIAPSGHGLKPLDIEFMKRLHEKVNIIPLIAKADTLTPEECQQFKKQIMKEIQEHKIKIYEFPETDDEEENKLVKKIKDRLPLAVVGSNTIIEVNGKRVRGRQYPWGVAEVENGEHCDFTILRNMLIRTHMQDLKDVTNNVHYENYRSRKLAAVTYNGVDNNKNKGQLTKSPLAQMEEERREHVAKMKKMEMEMEQVFEMKVKEKVQKLKDSEAELQRRHEQMKKNLEAQHKELEEKRRQFEEEKANWEAQQRILEQQNSSRTLEKNKKKGKIF
ncbi:septin-7 isoform X2 [Microtus pennsylvanicus]|uniref:septin-7 isoform X2 n=1 Tax=Microtus pennsylvanicus TaxID=10058 RepID=UPI003F6AF33B